jgi:ribosomal protein S15P/S13E
MATGIDPRVVVGVVRQGSRSEIEDGRSVDTSRLLAEASAESDAFETLIDTVNRVLKPSIPLKYDAKPYDTLNQVIDLWKENVSDKSFIDNFKKVLTHNKANVEFLVAVANDLTKLIDKSKDDEVKLYEFKIKIIKLKIKYFEEQIESKLGHKVLNLLKKPLELFIKNIDSLNQSDEGKQLDKYTKIFRLNNHILSRLNKFHTRLFQPIESEDINKIKSNFMICIMNMINLYETLEKPNKSPEELNEKLKALRQEIALLDPRTNNSLVYLCSIKKILYILDPTETDLLKKLDNKFIEILNGNQSDAAVIETFQAAQLYCRYYQLKFDIKKYQIDEIDESKLISAACFENIQSLLDNEQSMRIIIDCLKNIFEISEHIKFSEFKSRHGEIYEKLKLYVYNMLENCQKGSISDEDLNDLKRLRDCFDQYEVTKHMSKYITVDVHITKWSKQIDRLLNSEKEDQCIDNLKSKSNKYFRDQYKLNKKYLQDLVSTLSDKEKSIPSDVSVVSTTELIEENVDIDPIQIFEKLYQYIDSLIKLETANLDALKEEFNEKNASKVITVEAEEPENHSQAETCDKKLDALEKLYKRKKEYQLRIDVLNNREVLRDLIDTAKSDSIALKSLDSLMPKVQAMLKPDSIKDVKTLPKLNKDLLQFINIISSILKKELNRFDRSLINVLTKQVTALEATENTSEEFKKAIADAKSLLQSSGEMEPSYIEQVQQSISELTCLQELQKNKETQEQYYAHHETLTSLVMEFNTIPNIPMNLSEAKGAAKSLLDQLSETQADDIAALTENIDQLTAHIEKLTSSKENYIKNLKTEQTRLTQTLTKIVSELKVRKKIPRNPINHAKSFLKKLSETQADDIAALTENIDQLTAHIEKLTSSKENYIKNLKTEQTRLTQTLTKIVSELKVRKKIPRYDITHANSLLNSLKKPQQNDIGELIKNITQLRDKICSIKTILNNQRLNDMKQNQDHLKELLGQKLFDLLIYFKNIGIEPYEFIITAQEYINALNLNEITEDNVVVNTKLEKFIKLAELAETMNKYYVLLDIYQICKVHQNTDFYEIGKEVKQVLNNSNIDIKSIEKKLNQLNESIQWHQNSAQNILTQHKKSITYHIQFIGYSYQQNCIGFQQTNVFNPTTASIFLEMNDMINYQFQQLNHDLNQLNALESSLKTQLQT